MPSARPIPVNLESRRPSCGTVAPAGIPKPCLVHVPNGRGGRVWGTQVSPSSKIVASARDKAVLVEVSRMDASLTEGQMPRHEFRTIT